MNKIAKEQLGRYGENPHQTAWKEVDHDHTGPTVLTEPLHGKPLGYNNLLDAAAALEIMLDLQGKPGVAVLKHTNPCGLATGDNLAEAFINAWYGDEVSAFGSIVGFTEKVTEDVVARTKGKFVEVLVAPQFNPGSIDWLDNTPGKEDVRVIATGPLEKAVEFEASRKIRGGKLSQTSDNRLYLCDSADDLLREPQTLTESNSGLEYQVGTVTETKFQDGMQGLMEFATIAGKHTKSNAIIIAYEYAPGKYRVLGMGAGQPNRKDSGEKLALTKARENLMRQYFREQQLNYPIVMDKMMRDPEYNRKITAEANAYINSVLNSGKVVLFSDAFFPKRDGLVAAAELGVRYIITPGGSKGDGDVTKAANERGIAMAFTGIRHFKH